MDELIKIVEDLYRFANPDEDDAQIQARLDAFRLSNLTTVTGTIDPYFVAPTVAQTLGAQGFERAGNRINWNGVDAGRLIGGNILLYDGVPNSQPANRRTQVERRADMDGIRAMGSNLVRLAVSPGQWREYSATIMGELVELADYAADIGMFFIVDYHGIGMPDGQYLTPGWDWREPVSPIYDSDFTLAESFWAAASTAFASKPWVIFELWNEPITYTRGDGGGTWIDEWVKIAPFWQTLITQIRAASATNFILVAGDHFARNLEGYDNQPLTDPLNNFGFAHHEYEYLESQNTTARLTAANGLMTDRFPFLGTEWGTKVYSPAIYNPDFLAYQSTYLDDKFQGWCNWAWSVTSTPNMLTAFDPPVFSPWGKFTKLMIGRESLSARPRRV